MVYDVHVLYQSSNVRLCDFSNSDISLQKEIVSMNLIIAQLVKHFQDLFGTATVRT